MVKRYLKLVLDALIYALAFILAYWIRFDGRPPEEHLRQLQLLIGLFVAVRLGSNFALGVYRHIWRYISLNDVTVLTFAAALPSMTLVLARLFLTESHQLWRVPYSVIVIDFLLAVGGTTALRVFHRAWFERNESKGEANPRVDSSKVNVLLVGAGLAGIMVAREARKEKNLNWNLVGFVDDDPKKLNTTIHGIKVIGDTPDIPLLVRARSVDRVIITIANATSKEIRRIVEICEAVPVPVKIVPAMCEILGDRVTIKKLRDVAIDDLLGREAVKFDAWSADMGQQFRGKCILVTGAGGSIGSEICRQLCFFSPSQLLLLEKDENGLYEIDSELAWSQPQIPRKGLVCDVRNYPRLSSLLDVYRPQVIFHAAAHKHVPLLEEHPIEAVTNNVQGTLNLLNLSEETGCERFVMLSSDKAVSPTSVMGASKRIAELMIQSFSNRKTHFSCVRFGNVLGSRGSVVPLFQAQIRNGGPITVTDRNVVRFFMTIPEAVQLVIQAATLGSSGEIYVLDMGNPVKIVDLAHDLIRLSGLEKDAIEITYTGLRPGEKLYEELFYPFEKASATSFAKILSIAPVDIDFSRFWETLNSILKGCDSVDRQFLRRSLFDLVSQCVPAEASHSQIKHLRPVEKFGSGTA
jgi:FlaA1/EpsC-like NDP-sugar epimerase